MPSTKSNEGNHTLLLDQLDVFGLMTANACKKLSTASTSDFEALRFAEEFPSISRSANVFQPLSKRQPFGDLECKRDS